VAELEPVVGAGDERRRRRAAGLLDERDVPDGELGEQDDRGARADEVDVVVLDVVEVTWPSASRTSPSASSR
jgi:hypothetical protein